jgi:hypothetical protein
MPIAGSVASAVDDTRHPLPYTFADSENFHPASVPDQDRPAELLCYLDGSRHTVAEFTDHLLTVADDHQQEGSHLEQFAGEIILRHGGLP